MAQGLAEALHLVLAALGERQPEPALSRSGALELDLEGSGGAVVQGDTAPPAIEVAPPDAPLDLSLVDPGQRVARMEQSVRQRAVVREKQRALDVPVQASHRIETHVVSHEIGDDRASLRIAERGDVAARLVEEHVVLGLGRRQPAAVDRDGVELGIGERGGTAGDGPVDGDVAVDDQAVTSPARGQPRLRQDLVESQLRHARRRPPAPAPPARPRPSAGRPRL